jgi:hypothetical protein
MLRLRARCFFVEPTMCGRHEVGVGIGSGFESPAGHDVQELGQ